MSENVRTFESLAEVTYRDVQWLMDGCELSRGRVYNRRSIAYTTNRGVAKSVTCFVMSDGSKRWRAWSLRNTYDHLSDEEARVFDPETYERRQARKDARRARQQEAQAHCVPVHIGDVFAGSYGYDATLWEFHQVVRVSASGKTVWTRELRHETATGYGYNDWKCRPALNDFRGREERHAVQYHAWNNGQPSITLTSYMSATLLTNVNEWHDADNYH